MSTELTETTKPYSKDVVTAPCGKRVKVPDDAIQGEWISCKACGRAHFVAKKDRDGRVHLSNY